MRNSLDNLHVLTSQTEHSAALCAFLTLPDQLLESKFPRTLKAISRNPAVILWNAKDVADFSLSFPISYFQRNFPIFTTSA